MKHNEVNKAFHNGALGPQGKKNYAVALFNKRKATVGKDCYNGREMISVKFDDGYGFHLPNSKKNRRLFNI